MAAFEIQNQDLVVVADGEKALFLVNEGEADYPNLKVFRQLAQDNPPNREQTSGRAGRMDDTGGVHKSAVQETDWHRLNKMHFARDIADLLYTMAHKGAYKRLIIAAPPVVLGEMRKALHREVQERVVAEIDKELTKHPIHEIEKILLR